MRQSAEIVELVDQDLEPFVPPARDNEVSGVRARPTAPKIVIEPSLPPAIPAAAKRGRPPVPTPSAPIVVPREAAIDLDFVLRTLAKPRVAPILAHELPRVPGAPSAAFLPLVAVEPQPLAEARDARTETLALRIVYVGAAALAAAAATAFLG